MNRNRAVSRIEEGPFNEKRVIDAVSAASAELGADATLGFLFVTPDYASHIDEMLELVRVYGRVTLLAGASGAGLIGTSREMEDSPGFSLLLLNLPDTRVTAFEFGQGQVQESAGPAYWQMESGVEETDAWIVLAHPARLDVDRWLRDWDTAYPQVPTLGGLASGGQTVDDIFVLRDGRRVDGAGAVAVALRGGVRVATIVSQGCRPIGEPLTVTGARQNVVLTLASKPAYKVLNEVFLSLSERERNRAGGNIFAGLAVSEYLEEFKRGDFLIRNILEADKASGAIAIGAIPRIGQTLQYQLRDRDSAHEELRELCAVAHDDELVRPFATLLFSCNGRGRGLFRVPDHDAGLLAEVFGAGPLAGFFCNGEIGPVGTKTFLHGYTASAALLCDA